jgi:hypothetical protein
MIKPFWMRFSVGVIAASLFVAPDVAVCGPSASAKSAKQDSSKYLQDHLADPKRLLPEHGRNKHLLTLNAHAADSKVDVYVYLMAAEQSPSDDPAVAGFVERVFSHDPAAVVVLYTFGAPGRAELHAGPRVKQRIAPGLLAAVLKGCMSVAAQETRPNEQLGAFVDMLVVRVCSMERLLESGSHVASIDLPPTSEEVVTSDSVRIATIAADCWEWLFAHFWLATAALASLVGFVLIWITRRLLSRHLFPPGQVAERLGAPHAAGVGEVIAFSDPRLPPAMQRGDA